MCTNYGTRVHTSTAGEEDHGAPTSTTATQVFVQQAPASTPIAAVYSQEQLEYDAGAGHDFDNPLYNRAVDEDYVAARQSMIRQAAAADTGHEFDEARFDNPIYCAPKGIADEAYPDPAVMRNAPLRVQAPHRVQLDRPYSTGYLHPRSSRAMPEVRVGSYEATASAGLRPDYENVAYSHDASRMVAEEALRQFGQAEGVYSLDTGPSSAPSEKPAVHYTRGGLRSNTFITRL